MLGLVLLCVGAVLFTHGPSMPGVIAPKEAAGMNLLTSGLSLFVSLHELGRSDPASIRAGAFGLRFAFACLWVACDNPTAQDDQGLAGSVPSLPQPRHWSPAGDQMALAIGIAGSCSAGCRAAWGVLYLRFFVIGALRRTSSNRPVGWLTIVQSVMTAWLPGHLLLDGRKLR